MIFPRHTGEAGEGEEAMEAVAGHGSEEHSMMLFHFSKGDALWFDNWMPSSPGAMTGACIGLFFMAVFFRFITVMLVQISLAFKERSDYLRILEAQHQHGSSTSISSDGSTFQNVTGQVHLVEKTSTGIESRIKNAPSFIWYHEMLRGFLAMTIAGVGYLLMLAVMTGNLFYFFAILLGTFAGEMSVGRYSFYNGH